MRKEFLFAIFGGALVGLTLAFGVWRANTALRSRNPKHQESSDAENSETTFGMTLASPEDFEVVSQSPFLVSGITKPNLFVAISSEESDFVIKSGQEGEFGKDIVLSEGVNEILITAFDAGGGTIKKQFLTVYSTEFAKQVTTASPSPTESKEETATPSNEVRKKVQEKVNEARKVPKFVMGSVTDKLATTIEIGDHQGEIKQISLSSEEAVFVKIAKTRSEVKFAEVAIGDFIVAMGFANGNGVLDGKRFLLTEEFEFSGRETLLGTISNLKKAEFTFKSIKNAEEFLVKNANDLTILNGIGDDQEEIGFSDLRNGQQVIIAGVKGDTNFVARTVVVVGQSPSL